MIYCGVDGGGTKTHIILADDEHIIGEIITSASAIDTVSLEEMYKVIFSAIKTICEDNNIDIIDSIFIGLGGVATQQDSQRVITSFMTMPYLNSGSIVVVDNDIMNAYEASCSGRHNITLIVGTGAVAFGMDEHNHHHRTNGIHYKEGDFGSGYDIGVRILERMSKAFDGRMNHSALTRYLLQQYNINTNSELSAFFQTYRDNRTVVASLAKDVVAFAKNNDFHAIDVLDEGAREMVLSFIAVDKNIQLQNKEVGVVGGLGITPLYFSLIKKYILEYNSLYSVHITDMLPVMGSLSLAKRNAMKPK